MQQIVHFMLAASLFLFSGCMMDQTIDKDDNISSRNLASPIYQVIKTGEYPADNGHYLNDPGAFLVFYSDSAEDVKAFEKEYYSITGEDAPTFSGTMVIATMGTMRSGGYSYAVDMLTESETNILLKLQAKKPQPDSIVTMALTNPYMIIFLPENHKEVKVTETGEETA